MTTTKDMLQALIRGQAALDAKIESGFKEVNDRLDKQGKQLAYLEDDAPTRGEFDELTKRVEKLEHN